MDHPDIHSLESLPYELLFNLAVNMNASTLFSLCQASTYLAVLCRDDTLWQRKFERDYPEFQSREAAHFFNHQIRQIYPGVKFIWMPSDHLNRYIGHHHFERSIDGLNLSFPKFDSFTILVIRQSKLIDLF